LLSYSIRSFVHLEKIHLSMGLFHSLRRNLIVMLEITELFQSGRAVLAMHNLIRWEMLLILRIRPFLDNQYTKFMNLLWFQEHEHQTNSLHAAFTSWLQ
jgi:hypothetical protein